MDGQESAANRRDEERAYYSFQKRSWSIFAPYYDALVILPLLKLRSRVASRVELPRGARLLDVATGTGAQARAFAGIAHEVVGIDLSEAMLSIARRKTSAPNVHFHQADAAQLPFEDLSFDSACVSFALHEMPASVRERVLAEMVRVTKPGASIVIVDYGLPSGSLARWLVLHAVKIYEGEHYAHFVAADLAALLEFAGIQTTEQHSALGGVARILIGVRADHPRRARPQGEAAEGLPPSPWEAQQ